MRNFGIGLPDEQDDEDPFYTSAQEAFRRDVMPQRQPDLTALRNPASFLYEGGSGLPSAPAAPKSAPSDPAPSSSTQNPVSFLYGDIAPAKQKKKDDSDFSRRFMDTFPETKALAAGAAAIVADAVGADSIRDSLLKTYKGTMDKVQETAKPSDSLSNVLEGNGDFIDWLQAGAGYVTGQAVQSIAVGAAGFALGSAVPGAGNIAGGLAGLFSKETAKTGLKKILANKLQDYEKRALAKGVTEQAAREAAVSTVFKGIGAATGLQIFNFTQELGSIYPEALEESAKTGEEYSLGRIFGAAALAASLDTLSDIYGFSALKGAKGGGKLLPNIAREGFKSGLIEGGTEGGQTVLERFGAKKDLANDEAIREYVDSVGLGALGGGLRGGVTGAVKSFRPEDGDTTPPPDQSPPKPPEDVIAARQSMLDDPNVGPKLRANGITDPEDPRIDILAERIFNRTPEIRKVNEILGVTRSGVEMSQDQKEQFDSLSFATNAREFVSEINSNPELESFLKDLPGTAGYEGNRYNQVMELYDRVINPKPAEPISVAPPTQTLTGRENLPIATTGQESRGLVTSVEQINAELAMEEKRNQDAFRLAELRRQRAQQEVELSGVQPMDTQAGGRPGGIGAQQEFAYFNPVIKDGQMVSGDRVEVVSGDQILDRITLGGLQTTPERAIFLRFLDREGQPEFPVPLSLAKQYVKFFNRPESPRAAQDFMGGVAPQRSDDGTINPRAFAPQDGVMTDPEATRGGPRMATDRITTDQSQQFVPADPTPPGTGVAPVRGGQTFEAEPVREKLPAPATAPGAERAKAVSKARKQRGKGKTATATTAPAVAAPREPQTPSQAQPAVAPVEGQTPAQPSDTPTQTAPGAARAKRVSKSKKTTQAKGVSDAAQEGSQQQGDQQQRPGDGAGREGGGRQDRAGQAQESQARTEDRGGNRAEEGRQGQLPLDLRRKEPGENIKSIDDLNKAAQEILDSEGNGETFRAVRVPLGDIMGKIPGIGLVQSTARLFGKPVVFFKVVEGTDFFDGTVIRGDDTIFININASHPHLRVFGHELVHAIRNSTPETYEKLLTALKPLLLAKGFSNFSAKQMARGVTTDHKILEEAVGDIVGDRFGESAFWEMLAENNPTGFRAVAEAVIGFIDRILAKIGLSKTLGSETLVKDLRAARREIARILADAQPKRADGQSQETGADLSRKRESDAGHKREKESGRYVGSPDWVGSSPQQLVNLRKKLKKLAQEGTPGRFWYEQSSKAILELAGGDKAEAERIVSLIAIYSPNATVPANTSMALRAYYQYKAGQPIKAGLGDGNRKAEQLLRQNQAWSGIKTNSFYQNLMVEINPSRLEEGVATMDMWMAIAFDYGMKTLDQGPKYKFAQREIQMLAKELGWTAHQTQAAIWTAMKGRVDPIRDKLKKEELRLGIGEMIEKFDQKTGKTKSVYVVKPDRKYEHFRLAHKMGMDYDLKQKDIEESKYDFSDAIRERTAQMSWEATPGKNTGVLPGLLKAPMDQKFEYLRAISDALTDKDGLDLIAKRIGLPSGKTFFGFSAWDGDIGAGGQTLTGVAMEGAGDKRDVTPESRSLLNLYSAIKGYVLNQEAVVWHVPDYNGAKKNQNGYEAKFNRALNEQEMTALYSALYNEFKMWKIAPGYTEDGFRLLNFDVDNAVFQEGLVRALGTLPRDFGGGIVDAGFYRSIGDYIGNDWDKSPNGEDYVRQIASAAIQDTGTGSSDLQAWSADLRSRIQAINQEFSKRYGWGNPGTAAGSQGRVDPKTPPQGGVSVSEPPMSMRRRDGATIAPPFSRERDVLAGIDDTVNSISPGRRTFIKRMVGMAVAISLPQSRAFASNFNSSVRNGNLQGALSAIETGSANLAFRTLARKLKGLTNNTMSLTLVEPGKVYPRGVPASLAFGAAGVARVNRQDGGIDIFLRSDVGANEETLLHEAIHAALLARYDLLNVYLANKTLRGKSADPALKLYERVWDEFRSHVNRNFKRYKGTALVEDLRGSLPLGVQAAYQNPDEFITYALTDPETQAWMQSRKYDGKSLWGRFKEFVASTLGFGGTEPSWLDAALRVGNEVLDQAVQDAPDYSTSKSVAKKFGKNEGTAMAATPVENRESGVSAFEPPMSMRRKDAATKTTESWAKGQFGDLIAPNGNPVWQNFVRWFGGSKVVDENGEPLVAYHGSRADILEFLAGKNAARDSRYTGDLGSWFAAPRNSTDKNNPREVANFFATDDGSDIPRGPRVMSGATVYPALLSIKNPAVFKSYDELRSAVIRESPGAVALRERLVAKGHDGILIQNSDTDVDAPRNDWIAFYPEQVKSAIGNSGNFDAEEPIMSFSRKPDSERHTVSASQKLTSGPSWIDNLPPEMKEPLRKGGAVPAKLTLADRFAALKENFAAKVVQGVFDKYSSIAKVSPLAYLQARMSTTVDGAFEYLLLKGQVKWDGDWLKDVPGTKGLKEILSQLPSGETDRFFWWIAANRAERLSKEDREFLFSSKDIASLKRLNQAGVGDRVANRPVVYAKVLNELNRLNKSVLDVAKESGLINDQQYARYASDAFYVPFYRMMDDGDIGGAATAAGLVGQKFSNKLKGSERQLNDLLQNYLNNWDHILSASARNMAARNTLKAAEVAGIAKAVLPGLEAPKGAVKVMVNGEAKQYVVDDPLLVDSISSIYSPAMSGYGVKIMGAFKRVFTRFITVSPIFKFYNNLIRDAITSQALSPELSNNPIANTYRGFRLMSKDSPIYNSMLVGGGMFKHATWDEGDRHEYVKRLIDAGVDTNTILNTPEKIQAFMSGAFKKYMEVGDRAENAQRAAIYDQAIKAGKSQLEASFAARTPIDFSLTGSFAAIRYLSAILPFFNARLQGMYSLGKYGIAPTARAMSNMTTGKETDANDLQRAMRFAGVTSAVTAATIFLYLMNKDDEDFKRRADWDRDSFWWIKINNVAWRIPKPFEIGAFATIVERGLEQIVDKNVEGKVFANRLWAIVTDQLSINLIPQMIRPTADVYANYDGFRDTAIESVALKNLPKQDRVTQNTSYAARALGSVSAEIAGIIEPVAGKKAANAIQLSPVQIDYLIKGYLGWVGAQALLVSDAAAKAVIGAPEQPTPRFQERIPVRLTLGNTIQELPTRESRYVNDFYEQAREINEVMNSIRHYKNAKDFEKVKELVEENRDKVALAKVYADVQKRLSEITKRVKMINDSKELSPDEKRARIDALEAERERLAKLAEERRKERAKN